jgi:hypothetical protein
LKTAGVTNPRWSLLTKSFNAEYTRFTDAIA